MAGTCVYVSNAEDDTIHVLAMDRESGALRVIEVVAVPGSDLPSPTSLPMVVSPDGRYLYAAVRSADFPISCFAIDPATGRLRHVATTPLIAPMAYLAIDRRGRFLLGASYVDAKLAVYPIDPATGGIEAEARQVLETGPHAHSILLDRTNHCAYSAILGADHVLQMMFDAKTGRLSANRPEAVATRRGAGPRHLGLHPNGRFLYLLNQTDATVCVFRIEPGAGLLAEIESLATLPAHFLGEANAADLHLTPDGRFLYISERQTSTLSGFRVDAVTGLLMPIGRWPTEICPRGFAIDPRGRFLLSAGLDSGAVRIHTIDQESGGLRPAGAIAVGAMPNWIEILDLQP